MGESDHVSFQPNRLSTQLIRSLDQAQIQVHRKIRVTSRIDQVTNP